MLAAEGGSTPPLLEVHKLSKAYGRRHALCEVSFDLAEGKGSLAPSGRDNMRVPMAVGDRFLWA